MDSSPSAIASTLQLVISIRSWLENQSREDNVIQSIFDIVNQINQILLPLHVDDNGGSGHVLYPSLLNGLQEALLHTKEHLNLWSNRSRDSAQCSQISVYFNPDQVRKVLNDDNCSLHQQLASLSFSLGVKTGVVGVSSGRTESNIPFHNVDAQDFWRDYVGAKIVWTPKDSFHHSLSSYLHKAPPAQSFERLLLALDEYNLGGVSSSTLDRLVEESNSFDSFLVSFLGSDDDGTESLVTLVDDLTVLPPNPILSHITLPIPLLIWVDDCPENNAYYMEYAESIGINVITITSTTSARDWIDTHSDFLRENNTGGRIRIVSDNTRLEFFPSTSSGSTSQPINNHFAGESIIRYIRSRPYLSRIPILIFTGSSIIYTRYVENYQLCGSTAYTGILYTYIKALKEGMVNDEGWRGYNRSLKGVLEVRF